MGSRAQAAGIEAAGLPLPLGNAAPAGQSQPVRSLLLAALILPLASVGWAQAQGSFSQSLSPADAASAGLDQLTPQQRAKLDELVEQYRSGALAAAEARAQAAERAQAAAQAEAARAKTEAANAKTEAAKAKASSGGFFAHAKAIIMPGTKIEYAAIEAHIVGRIRGWDRNTVFVLDNGQRWKVADYSDYFSGRALENPKVTIEPHLGGFKMHIEGMSYLSVRLISGPIYKEQD